MTRRVLLAAAVVLPAVAGVIAAVALTLAQVRTQAVITLSVTAIVALAGLLASALVGLVVAAIVARGRRDAELTAVRAAGEREGSENERAAHRRFLARLDHELKNPVTAIRATIAADPQTADGARGSLAVIDGQATRLAHLVGELRKLADLETRALDLELVDLESIVAESVAGAAGLPDAASRLTMTVTRVPWPVPPVRVDPDLLGVAIDNLLSNALKFGDGPVEVRLREDAGWAVVEVGDAGRGIPSDDVAHVFDELARARNARDVTGSGIGLSLVRTIARRHGGDVELRSREAEGTVVMLRLPTAGR